MLEYRAMYMYLVVCCVLCAQTNGVFGENKEPTCSRFHYEEQYLEKMIRMEIKFENLLDGVKNLETSVRSDLQAIKSERDEEKREFGKFQSQQDDVLKSLVSKMTEFSHDQEQKLASLSAVLFEVQNQTRLSEDTVKPQAIAFEAHKVTNRGPSVGETIKFSETKVNLGDGYNNTSGHFTTPIDGVYLLMVQLCLINSNYIQIDIMVNGEVRTASQASAYQYYLCSSRQTVLSLKSGDGVWVQCANRQDTSTFTEGRNHVNSFSGFLIG